MKTFRDHLKEEVKIGALASGGIDIERDAIRDEINGILSAIASRPCVTPYASLNKIRKALAYFHIHLPKRVYLEGRHGIEVWEVNQFGDKMGVTDQGEWIKHVPCKYYLFFHYHRMGGMYYMEAKIVDDNELETRVNTAEKMVAEEMDAAMRQDLAKAKAPKEDPHTALGDCDCSQGDSPSTKKAVNVSIKKIDEGRGMPASVIKHKQKLAGMTPEEKKKHFAGKSEEELKSMARRHGYGKDSDEYSKHVTKMEEDKDPCWKGYEMVGMKKKGGRKVPNCVPVKEEEQIDELDQKTMLSYKSAAKDDRRVSKAIIKKGSDTEGRWKHAAKKRKIGLKLVKKRLGEEQIDEKAPPGAKFERMVKHIKKGYSKDGLTTKEKGIAYATAWKAKKRESKD